MMDQNEVKAFLPVLSYPRHFFFNSYYSYSYRVILVFPFKNLLFFTVEFLFSSYEFVFG